MKSKLSIAAILGVLGLLTTVLVALPAMGEQGSARFLDASGGDEIDWTNPSDTITIEVTDSDLDVPIKRVIQTSAGSADVTALPGTVTTNGTTALVHSTSTGLTLEVGNTVLVEGETVREVTARSGTSTTVNVAFTTSAAGVDAFEVTATDGSFDNCPDCFAANVLSVSGTTPLSVGDGSTQTFAINDLLDLLDSNVGEAFANRFDGDADTGRNVLDLLLRKPDGTAVPTDITPSIDLTNGTLTITNASGGATAGKYTDTTSVMYWFADENNTQDFVTVTSEADENGITVTLTETFGSSGVFEGTLALCQAGDINCSSATTTTPRIEVGDNDTITVTYADPDESDTTGEVTVEATEPSFGNFSPADLFATVASRPRLSVDVTDSDSGIALDSDDVPDITFVMRTTELDGTQLDAPRTEPEPAEVSITGGHTVSTLVPRTLTPDEDVYLIEWWIVADDLAGNRGVSDNPDILDSNDDQTDCTTGTFDLDTGGSAMGGCDPYQVRVDLVGPTLTSATTGNWFDTVDEEIQSGTDAITTSIQLVFNEALAEDSLDLADFDSAGFDIDGIDWYSDEPESVFLTVEALDADDEPTIALVAEISDAAGNVSDDDEVDSDDGIPSSLIITVTGVAASQPITDETITIGIMSDEPLSGAPTVTINRVEDDEVGGATTTPSVSLVATRSWEAEVDLVGAGVYNVIVSGTDLGASIVTTVGAVPAAATGVIDLTDEDGFFFEVDNDVAAPTFPLTANDTDNPDTFISADFSNEANEYGLDTADDHTVDETAVDDSHDTHDTLTLVSFTLDGDDVTAEVSTTDDLVFLYKASGLALGEHTVVIEVEDEVKNSSGEVEHIFEVSERALFEVPLVPGWNMISVPGDPAATAIDSVIGTGVPVTAVYGYDPSVPGGWLTAVREAADDGTFGAFAGTLTDLNPNLGYWVLTSTFQPIEVDIPQLTAGAATVGEVLPPQPPSIDIVVGWNLVAVLDVTATLDAAGEDTLDADNSVDSDVYLAGLEISRVLRFDTLENAWQVIVPDGTLNDGGGTEGDDNLGVGNAYWLFATEVGTLVP